MIGRAGIQRKKYLVTPPFQFWPFNDRSAIPRDLDAGSADAVASDPSHSFTHGAPMDLIRRHEIATRVAEGVWRDEVSFMFVLGNPQDMRTAAAAWGETYNRCFAPDRPAVYLEARMIKGTGK